jgi:hypothetical protein
VSPNTDDHANADKIEPQRKKGAAYYLKIATGALVLLLTQFRNGVRKETTDKSQQRADEHLIAAATHRMARYTGCLAVFTFLSVVIAGFTVWILQSQLIEMKAEQRPFVGQIAVDASPLKIGPFQAIITIKNTGTQPALRVVICRTPKVVKPGDSPPAPMLNRPRDCASKPTILMPGAEGKTPLMGDSYIENQAALNVLKSGAWSVWVSERVEYDDLKGGRYYFWLRQRYNPALGTYEQIDADAN